MDNLYDKIYNAINEGIIKSLQTDNDINITYSRSKVNNSIYSKEQFDEAVDNLFDKQTIENYNNVLKYSMRGIHQHKVKDYDELTSIFNKISKITDDIDLSWINTINILTFIMKNGSELSLGDIDNINDVMFIKFNNVQDFDYPIIIHKNQLISNSDKAWSTIEVDTKSIDKKDGYKNTYNTNIINDLDHYPAFEYCVNQSINEYKGYLPSINELEFLSKNEKTLNYIQAYLTGIKLSINLEEWWSSTQRSVTGAFILINGTSHNDLWKNHDLQVFPLFRKIK